MNKLDIQYQQLLKDILEFGVEKQDRTGTGTKSLFGYTIRHNMQEGFPLLTTKKMAWKSLVTELLWFLKGDTNIKYLVDNDCHIWNGDAYKRYHQAFPETEMMSKEDFINKIKTDDEFAKKWGELGPIYGKQWRAWGDGGYSTWTDENDKVMHKHRTDYPQVDQIQNLINNLKTNPDSRRLIVNAWNVGELDQMVLPPCHYGFQVYTQEREGKRYISLMWNQRSVDTFLGLPFNIASYGLLLEILAKEVNMVPDQLIGNLGDVHLYSNHIEQAKKQIDREPFELPKLKINFDVVYKDWECLPHYVISDFVVENYKSHPAIKAPLSN